MLKFGNLEMQIRDDEFWVKMDKPEEWADRLEQLGLIEYAYERVSCGWPGSYATLWKLK
jgi:hypothetical protein